MAIKIQSQTFNNFLVNVKKNVSSPEQRLILGVTALFSQPFIDLHNSNVDKETRRISTIRTIAKIIVGTTVGVLVRKGCINLAKLKCFQPEHNLIKDASFDKIRRYTNTMGTLLATGIAVFTNFMIDAPLTKLLTNKIDAHLTSSKNK